MTQRHVEQSHLQVSRPLKVVVALEQRFLRFRGEIYCSQCTWKRLWSRYLEVFDEVVVLARVLDVDAEPTEELAGGPGVSWLAVPHYQGPAEYLGRRWAVQQVVEEAAEIGDAFILRTPGTISGLLHKELRRRKLPYQVEVVGDPYDSLAPGANTSLLRPLARWLHTRQLKAQCRDAAVAAYVTREALQRRYPSNGVTTHYSSVELDQDAFAEAPRQWDSASPGREWVCVHVGTMSQLYKRQDRLIEAVAECRARGVPLRLRLVGGGQLMDSFRDLAQRLGIAQYVEFLGPLPAGEPVRKVLDSADIFVLPSMQEGLPRALIEAMARGLPCLATNVGGTSELLGPGELLEPSESISDGICELLRDPQRMASLSRRNLEHVRQYDASLLQARRRECYRHLRRISIAGSASPPKRVMLITAVPSTMRAFICERIEALQKAGYDVIAVSSPDADLEHIRAMGVRCIPLPIPRVVRPLRFLQSWWALLRIIRRLNPSLIHTETPIAAVLGQSAGWLAGVKGRINTVHGLYFVNVRQRLVRELYRMLELVACRLATHVISVNREDARYIASQIAVPAEAMSVLNVGVNLERVNPQAAGRDARDQIRHKFNIPADAFVFGTMARLVREKGLVELFDAFAQVAARHANVYLFHVGPPDHSRGDRITEAELTRPGFADRCRFAGQRYDIASVLAAMDVFVLPSHREGFPVSIMEAAAMGLPCITTDIRGCREAVLDGVTGLIVPPRDVVSLVAAMEHMLLSSEMRQKMGQAALQQAHSNFDRARVVEQTLALYEQVRKQHQ